VSELLVSSREERVLRLTMNRAEKKNALNLELCTALVEAAEAAERDAGVGCILLDARGDIFCAGMDLDEATAPGAVAGTAVHERLFTLGMRLTKPVVAAVQGPALGGGVGLIATSHIAVAAQGCNFGLTEVRVGLWPFLIWRTMVGAIGERRALAAALTGRIFSANEALQWGLIHEIAPPFEVDDRATAIAVHIAEASSNVIRLGLGFAHGSRELGREDAIRLALDTRAHAFASPEFREGVAAMREKRKPRWNEV
jgi:enoyl-CoA hydratase/carnithine racemase